MLQNQTRQIRRISWWNFLNFRA